MNLKTLIEEITAQKIVIIDESFPFTWSSGMQTPVYCDNRKILSVPSLRNAVIDHLCALIQENKHTPDYIAGVATAGISWGAYIADRLNLPYVYVRPQAKGHGLKKTIEGFLPPHKSVVVIEDLISTGKSSLAAIQELKKNENNIMALYSIMNYGLTSAQETFKGENFSVHSLLFFQQFLEHYMTNNLLAAEKAHAVHEWYQKLSS